MQVFDPFFFFFAFLRGFVFSFQLHASSTANVTLQHPIVNPIFEKQKKKAAAPKNPTL
jgi:hypothetical protein